MFCARITQLDASPSPPAPADIHRAAGCDRAPTNGKSGSGLLPKLEFHRFFEFVGANYFLLGGRPCDNLSALEGLWQPWG